MSFLICVLMYVSSVPVIAGLRNASAQDKDAASEEKELAIENVRASVGGQVVGVLQKNGITLLVCLFILCITEGPHLRLVLAAGDESTDPFVGIFALVYEVAKALDRAFSFCIGFLGLRQCRLDLGPPRLRFGSVRQLHRRREIGDHLFDACWQTSRLALFSGSGSLT